MRSVRPAYEHASRRYPEEVADPGLVSSIRLARTSFSIPSSAITFVVSNCDIDRRWNDSHHVHSLVDEGLALVRGVLILERDQLVDVVESVTSNLAGEDALDDSGSNECDFEEEWVRSVKIDRRDVAAMGRPLDFVVRLDVKFLQRSISQRSAERIIGSSPLVET